MQSMGQSFTRTAVANYHVPGWLTQQGFLFSWFQRPESQIKVLVDWVFLGPPDLVQMATCWICAYILGSHFYPEGCQPYQISVYSLGVLGIPHLYETRKVQA